MRSPLWTRPPLGSASPQAPPWPSQAAGEASAPAATASERRVSGPAEGADAELTGSACSRLGTLIFARARAEAERFVLRRLFRAPRASGRAGGRWHRRHHAFGQLLRQQLWYAYVDVTVSTCTIAPCCII